MSIVLHFSVSKSCMPRNHWWVLECFRAEFYHLSFGRESVLHAQTHFIGKSVVMGMTWQAWAYWRAAANDSPYLASSLDRQRWVTADMTLPLHFFENKLVLIFWMSNSCMPCDECWLGGCFMAEFSHFHLNQESLLHTQASFIGKFLLHAPC